MTDAIEVFYTREELIERAEKLSQRALGVDYKEAWRRVQAGLYPGSLLDSKLRQIFFLLEDD